MPTYQYACKSCGHRFEIVQSFSDSSLSECPECQGDLRKVFNSVGVVFKGSGFYRNDSRSGSTSSIPSESSTSSESKPAGDGSTTSGTSTKPSAPASTSTSAPAATPAAAS